MSVATPPDEKKRNAWWKKNNVVLCPGSPGCFKFVRVGDGEEAVCRAVMTKRTAMSSAAVTEKHAAAGKRNPETSLFGTVVPAHPVLKGNFVTGATLCKLCDGWDVGKWKASYWLNMDPDTVIAIREFQ
jgi:hypothetical protein